MSMIYMDNLIIDIFGHVYKGRINYALNVICIIKNFMQNLAFLSFCYKGLLYNKYEIWPKNEENFKLNTKKKKKSIYKMWLLLNLNC